MSTTMQPGSVDRAGDDAGWRRSPDLPLFRGLRADRHGVRVSVAAFLLGVAIVALCGPQRASAQDCDGGGVNVAPASNR